MVKIAFVAHSRHTCLCRSAPMTEGLRCDRDVGVQVSINRVNCFVRVKGHVGANKSVQLYLSFEQLRMYVKSTDKNQKHRYARRLRGTECVCMLWMA